MTLFALPRSADVSISAGDLFVRYKIACDLKQPVDRESIADAIRRWCRNFGISAVAIQFVTTAEQIKTAARAAGASRMPWDARVVAWDVWAAKDAKAAWAVRHAWNASAARDAWAARDASARRDARARRDTAWADWVAVVAVVAVVAFVIGAALDSAALTGWAETALFLAALAMATLATWARAAGDAWAVWDSWDVLDALA